MQLAGRYTLVRRMAAGGMAEVWEGSAVGEQGFVRRVAIKRMLQAEAGGEAFTRMFLDEARIVSQLHHANIVGIIDFGVADGAPFQVLELVDGLDAARLLEHSGSKLPLPLALHLCAEIAHALAYAHEATSADGAPLRIVHRDVSPQNILVSWSGDVKLSDFGIAVAQGRLEQTMAGVTKGKPAYMAPEQMIRGELDGRTDVFALGCVLHALATGRSPLAGENRMADLLAGAELPVDSALPDDVQALVRRAVARSKDARFPSAAAFAETCATALRARLAGDPRTALHDHLRALRPGTPRPRRTGALDALLDPFAVLEDKATPRPPETPERSGPRAVAEAPAPMARAQPRWRWRGVVATGVLGVTAALVWLFRESEAARPSQRSEAVSAAPTTPTTEVPPVAEQTPDASMAQVAEPPRTPARREPARPAKPAKVGTLVVGGEGALRAEIRVDGRSVGFAPSQLELPVGERAVELVLPGGARWGPRKIRISEHHTGSQPYRLQLPEASPAAH